MKVWLSFCLCLAGCAPLSAPASAFPVKLSPGQHCLVDQNNNPFFLQGEAAWSMIAQLSRTQCDQYLADRAARGFNTILVNLIEHQYATYAPSNFYGIPPFTRLIDGTHWDFTTPNEAYFTNADWMIQRADHYGIQVLLTPAYCGVHGGSQGWYQDMVANGTNNLRYYGRFLGGRYKNFNNIIWVNGGDYNAPDKSLVDAVAYGISDLDTNHLQTAHAGGDTSGLGYYVESWNQINTTYTYQPTYIYTLNDYSRAPVTPVFLIESKYELENGASDLTCRQEAYWAVFSGAMGHVFGNRYIWQFAAGWQTNLASPGSATITNVIKLMNSRPWADCVPDSSHLAVVGGYGTWGDTDYVAATLEATGKTLLAYIPQGQTKPTVNLSKISGASANAWWYDPRTGTATSIGAYPTTNTMTFTPPDTNDWVLVVDAASANLPPPGSQKLRLPPSVDAGPSRFIPWPQNQVTLNPTVTFDGPPPDPSAVTYQWTVESGPDAVSFSPTNNVEAVTARFNAAGVYRLRLQVEDSGQASQSEVTVTLRTNSAPAAPGGLLCQRAVNPVAVTTTSPFLSWTFFDPDAGDAQSACRLELLDSANRLFWDSGKVSSTNAGILYSGPPLVPGYSYTWKVMVWDGFDVPGSFSESAAFLLANASGELLTNGGFETGDATGWINLGGGQMNVGFNPPNGNKAAHSGIYQAYWDDSSDLYGAYQQVDVSAYAAAIDAGVARLQAAGWLVSNDYQASPPYDQFYLRIQFFDASGRELAPARYDTGVMNVPEWAAYGLQNFTLPPSTRNIRVEFNCWENGYDAGSADDFSLQLFLPTTLTVLTASLPGGVMGNPYSVQLQAEGGLAPLGWELAAGSDPLPAGLALSEAGELAGTPTVSGTFSLSFRVTDAQGHSAYRTLPLTVGVQPVTITTSALIPAKRGLAYSAALNAGGGSPPYLWTLSAGSAPLPAGITLGTNGVLQGTAAITGSFPFTPQVFDGLGTTAVRDLILQVDPAELRLETFPQTPAQIRAAGFQFWLYSEAPGLFAVERSFNLADWSELLTTDYDGGLLLLSDTNVNGSNHWFYRGRRQ